MGTCCSLALKIAGKTDFCLKTLACGEASEAEKSCPPSCQLSGQLGRCGMKRILILSNPNPNKNPAQNPNQPKTEPNKLNQEAPCGLDRGRVLR